MQGKSTCLNKSGEMRKISQFPLVNDPFPLKKVRVVIPSIIVLEMNRTKIVTDSTGFLYNNYSNDSVLE